MKMNYRYIVAKLAIICVSISMTACINFVPHLKEDYSQLGDSEIARYLSSSRSTNNDRATKKGIQELMLKAGMSERNYSYSKMTSLGFSCSQQSLLKCEYAGIVKYAISTSRFESNPQYENSLSVLISFDESKISDPLSVCWRNLAFSKDRCDYTK